MWLYHKVMSPKDVDRMANSVDPDQTARSTVCQGLFRIITVHIVPNIAFGLTSDVNFFSKITFASMF